MLDTEARELVNENARLHTEIDALKAQLLGADEMVKVSERQRAEHVAALRNAEIETRRQRDKALAEVDALKAQLATTEATAQRMKCVLEKALPIIDKEADMRDDAMADASAVDLARPYFTEMSDLADEIRAAKGEGNGPEQEAAENRRSEKYYTAERARNNSVLLHIPAAAYYLTWAEATQLCHSLIEALGVSAQLNGQIESEGSA